VVASRCIITQRPKEDVSCQRVPFNQDGIKTAVVRTMESSGIGDYGRNLTYTGSQCLDRDIGRCRLVVGAQSMGLPQETGRDEGKDCGNWPCGIESLRK